MVSMLTGLMSSSSGTSPVWSIFMDTPLTRDFFLIFEGCRNMPEAFGESGPFIGRCGCMPDWFIFSTSSGSFIGVPFIFGTACD